VYHEASTGRARGEHEAKSDVITSYGQTVMTLNLRDYSVFDKTDFLEATLA
jgi:hypothetical protein